MKISLKLDRKSAIWAVLHSVVVCAGCYYLTYSARSSFFFLILTLTAYAPKVQITSRKLRYAAIAGIGLISAVLCFAFVQFTIDWASILSMGVLKLLLNVLCSLTLIALIYTFTLSIKLSCILSMVIILLLATANSYVVRFRGSSLQMADLFAIRTALNVAGNYQYSVDNLVLYGWLFATVWTVFLISGIEVSCPSPKRLFLRCASVIVVLVCIVSIGINVSCVERRAWPNEGMAENGFMLYFSTQVGRVEKPDGYDTFDYEKLESQYSQQSNAIHTPNIIVIMDESFADLRIYDNKLSTNIPVMPFYDSLTENTVKGYTLCSTFGGGTANSEYEFLTGNTMAFLPSGISAYQNVVKDDTYSLVTYLNCLGYTSIAMHPESKNNWMRVSAWPALGFDKAYFIEDFPCENLVRGHVSDQEVFEQVIRIVNHQDADTPVFLFCVTMQNHSGYTEPGYANAVKLTGYTQEYPQANQYLSLIHETDAALEYLIRNLETSERDTVVLFYGDHQPKLDDGFVEELYGRPFETLEEQELRYAVPFFIWANYDISPKTVELTSLNYLGNHLLDCAGIPLSPYQNFLADLERRIPAINVLGYVNAQGEVCGLEGNNDERLWHYSILQYNSICGEDTRNQVFFPKPKS